MGTCASKPAQEATNQQEGSVHAPLPKQQTTTPVDPKAAAAAAATNLVHVASPQQQKSERAEHPAGKKEHRAPSVTEESTTTTATAAGARSAVSSPSVVPIESSIRLSPCLTMHRPNATPSPPPLNSTRRPVERPSSSNSQRGARPTGLPLGPSSLRIATHGPGASAGATEENQSSTPVRSRRPSLSGTHMPNSSGRPLHQRSMSVDVPRKLLLDQSGTRTPISIGSNSPPRRLSINGGHHAAPDCPDSPFRSGRYDQIGGVPQPMSWANRTNSCSNLLQSRYGSEALSAAVEHPSVGGGVDSSFLARTESVWAYYAKSASATELSKKGLYRLSEDVLDEFIERYKARLRKIHEDDKSYGQAEVDRDLRADLPLMLPAKMREGQQVLGHDDFVKYIMKYAMNKLIGSAGQVSRSVSRRPSVSLSRAPGDNTAAGNGNGVLAAAVAALSESPTSGLIKKREFIRGWRSCQAELFALVHNADGRNASICSIM
jgi:hypothetical protein